MTQLMPVLPVFAKGRVLGDLLKAEFHPAYNSVGGMLHNASSSVVLTIADPVGMPLKISTGKFVPVLQGDEASTTHLLYQQGPMFVPVSGDVQVAVLARGPIVVSGDYGLPDKDVAGNVLNKATIITALKALNFVFVFGSLTESVK